MQENKRGHYNQNSHALMFHIIHEPPSMYPHDHSLPTGDHWVREKLKKLWLIHSKYFFRVLFSTLQSNNDMGFQLLPWTLTM